MSVRNANRLANTLLYAGVGLALALALAVRVMPPMNLAILAVPVLLALGLVTAGAVVLYRHWRCPHCGAHLPTRGWSDVNCCPACGEKIDQQ